MKRNSTELKVKYHGDKDKPTRKKNPNVADISRQGYRDDSPYRSMSSIDIDTPSGRIDMSGTGIPLWANGRILPPYSGIHQFDTTQVKEIPLAQTGRQVKVYTDPKEFKIAEQAYRDSLNLYNTFKNAKDNYRNLITSNGFNPAYIEEWATDGYVDTEVHPRIGAVKYGILQNSGGGYDRDSEGKPRDFNYYPTATRDALGLKVYADTELGKAIGKRYPIYKKPVQPVAYQARPKIEPVQFAPMREFTFPSAEMQPAASPYPVAGMNTGLPTHRFTAAGYPMVDTDRNSPTFGKTITVPEGYSDDAKEKKYRGNKQKGGSLPMAQDSTEFYNMERAKQLYTPDETGHWPSVDYETGEWLKSKQHPTAWMEYLYGHTLNPQQALNYDVRVNSQGYFGDNTLQYVRNKKQGGSLLMAQTGLIVNDPNDPRLKAYQDSSSLNTMYPEVKGYWKPNEMVPEYFNKLTKKYSKGKIKPVGVNPYKVDSEDLHLPVFKKPVQPVAYQARPKIEPVQFAPMREFTFPSAEIQLATNPYPVTQMIASTVDEIMMPSGQMISRKAFIKQYGEAAWDRATNQGKYKRQKGGSLPLAQDGTEFKNQYLYPQRNPNLFKELKNRWVWDKEKRKAVRDYRSGKLNEDMDENITVDQYGNVVSDESGYKVPMFKEYTVKRITPPNYNFLGDQLPMPSNVMQAGGSLPKAQRGMPQRLVVYDPNDPNLKAYQDSSDLYRGGKKAWDFAIKEELQNDLKDWQDTMDSPNFTDEEKKRFEKPKLSDYLKYDDINNNTNFGRGQRYDASRDRITRDYTGSPSIITSMDGNYGYIDYTDPGNTLAHYARNFNNPIKPHWAFYGEGLSDVVYKKPVREVVLAREKPIELMTPRGGVFGTTQPEMPLATRPQVSAPETKWFTAAGQPSVGNASEVPMGYQIMTDEKGIRRLSEKEKNYRLNKKQYGGGLSKAQLGKELKDMLDKISRSKRMPKIPKSKLILQDDLLFPVDDAGLPAPGNPVDRDIYIKNLPPAQWLQEKNQWLKDNPQQQPMMEARQGGSLPAAQFGIPGKFKKKMADPTYGYGAQWLADWYSNPETQKRLQQSGLSQEDLNYAFENMGDTMISQTYPETMANVKKSLFKDGLKSNKVNDLMGLMSDDVLTSMQDVRGFASDPEEGLGIVYVDPGTVRRKEATLPHELMHASTLDRKIAGQLGAYGYTFPKMKEFYPDLYKAAKKSKDKGAINNMFQAIGSDDEQGMFREIYPYIQSVRYEMGIKPGETITQEMLDNYAKSYEEKAAKFPQRHVTKDSSLDRLLKLYSKPKLIQFMNTVAYNPNEQEVPMARFGGLPMHQTAPGQTGNRSYYYDASSEKPSWQDYMAVYNSAQNYKNWLQSNPAIVKDDWRSRKLDVLVGEYEKDLLGTKKEGEFYKQDDPYYLFLDKDVPVDPETGTRLGLPKFARLDNVVGRRPKQASYPVVTGYTGGIPQDRIMQHNEYDYWNSKRPENWLWIAEKRRQELEKGFNPWTNKPIPGAPEMNSYFKPLNKHQFLQGDISPFVFETASLNEEGKLETKPDITMRPDDPAFGTYPRIPSNLGAPLQLFDTRIKPSRLVTMNAKESGEDWRNLIGIEKIKDGLYANPGGFPECPGCMSTGYYYDYDLPEDMPYISTNQAFKTNYVNQTDGAQSGSSGSGQFYWWDPDGKKGGRQPIAVTKDQYDSYKKQGMLEVGHEQMQGKKRKGGALPMHQIPPGQVRSIMDPRWQPSQMQQIMINASKDKARTDAVDKLATQTPGNPNYGKSVKDLQSQRTASVQKAKREEYLQKNPGKYNVMRDMPMGIQEPGIQDVDYEMALLPASLPFKGSSLLGKAAIEAAEFVNPFSGFGIKPGNVFKMAGRDGIDKTRLDALLDAINKQNQQQTRPITEDIIKEYGEGFDWLKDWYSNPETLKRWKDLGFSKSANLQRQLRGLHQGNFDVKIHPDVVEMKDKIGSFFSTSDKQLMNDLKIGPTGVMELYPHHPVHTTGNYIPEAGVSVPMSRANVAVHEGTHFVTKGDVADKYISPYTDEIYKNALSPKQRLLMFMFPDKPVYKGLTGKDINYFTSPAETYARINEIRRNMDLKPGQVVNESDLKGFLTNNARYTGLEDMSALIFKNPEGIRKLTKAMNVLPAAAGVGTIYGASQMEPATDMQQQKKGGSKLPPHLPEAYMTGGLTKHQVPPGQTAARPAPVTSDYEESVRKQRENLGIPTDPKASKKDINFANERLQFIETIQDQIPYMETMPVDIYKQATQYGPGVAQYVDRLWKEELEKRKGPPIEELQKMAEKEYGRTLGSYLGDIVYNLDSGWDPFASEEDIRKSPGKGWRRRPLSDTEEMRTYLTNQIMAAQFDKSRREESERLGRERFFDLGNLNADIYSQEYSTLPWVSSNWRGNLYRDTQAMGDYWSTDPAKGTTPFDIAFQFGTGAANPYALAATYGPIMGTNWGTAPYVAEQEDSYTPYLMPALDVAMFNARRIGKGLNYMLNPSNKYVNKSILETAGGIPERIDQEAYQATLRNSQYNKARLLFPAATGVLAAVTPTVLGYDNDKTAEEIGIDAVKRFGLGALAGYAGTNMLRNKYLPKEYLERVKSNNQYVNSLNETDAINWGYKHGPNWPPSAYELAVGESNRYKNVNNPRGQFKRVEKDLNQWIRNQKDMINFAKLEDLTNNRFFEFYNTLGIKPPTLDETINKAIKTREELLYENLVTVPKLRKIVEVMIGVDMPHLLLDNKAFNMEVEKTLIGLLKMQNIKWSPEPIASPPWKLWNGDPLSLKPFNVTAYPLTGSGIREAPINDFIGGRLQSNYGPLLPESQASFSVGAGPKIQKEIDEIDRLLKSEKYNPSGDFTKQELDALRKERAALTNQLEMNRVRIYNTFMNDINTPFIANKYGGSSSKIKRIKKLE